jgi:hypothetical protein
MDLEEVHDDANVDEWPHLLEQVGKRYAFV